MLEGCACSLPALPEVLIRPGCGCADLFTPFFNFVNDSMDGVKEMIEHPLTHIGIGELPQPPSSSCS